MYNQAQELINLTKKSRTKTKTKILAIASGKGGVGKSTICANMAYKLSIESKKVLIVDADLGLANMQVILNVKSSYSFYDYINRKVPLEKILLKTSYKNIDLCAGQNGYQYASLQSLFLFSDLIYDIEALGRYDFILLDVGAGIHEYVQEFLQIADEIISISSINPSAITDMYALMKFISLKKNRSFIIFNETNNFHTGENIANSLSSLAAKNNISNNFMVKYIGNIVKDESVNICTRQRKLFTQVYKNTNASICFDTIFKTLFKEILI